MRRTHSLIAFGLALGLALPAAAGTPHNCREGVDNTCQTDALSLPTSVDQHLKRRDEIGKDPWGGAVLFLHALMVRPENKKLSDQLLVLTLHESRLEQPAKGAMYKGYAYDAGTDYLIKQVDKNAHCIRGHAIGAEPANNYRSDPDSIEVKFRVQRRYVGAIETGSYKVFACNGGTSTCRPIKLQKNKLGYWKVVEFSTVAVGCAAPATSGKDAADEL